MHRATPSTSSASSSSSTHRSKQRQLTRDQLLKSLRILGPDSAPLPSELPPSPPPSRRSSPAPALKRRIDVDPEHGQNKRPRTSSVSSSSSHLPPPSRPVPVASSSRHEPAEDGEVKDDPPASPHPFTTIQLPPNFPVRRPRRGNNMPASEWEAIYDKCFANGRMLKYSAYARVAAAHPTTSKDYKALRVSPAPNSPYASHSLLMARLELVDSLLHFIYGLWCKEYGVRTCYRASWRTVDEALTKTELKWQAESRDDREKAFLGLVQMVYAFIHGRKLRYHMTMVDQENEKKLHRIKLQWEMEQKQKNSQKGTQHTPSNVTPKMLPSPASSSTTSSSNSTPLGGHGTPGHNTSVPPAEVPSRAVPPTLPPSTVLIDVNAQFIWENKSQSGGLRVSLDRIERSQATLNLPILLKHFPRTFARMINSTLTPQDEHEPDFQDDECELYWPGQVITGEGLGWVCLMGMSMVKEFGRDYGYLGINGVIPRLPGDENLGYAEPRFVPHSR